MRCGQETHHRTVGGRRFRHAEKAPGTAPKRVFFGEKVFFFAFGLAFFAFLQYNSSKDTRAFRTRLVRTPVFIAAHKRLTPSQRKTDTMNIKIALKSAAVSLALAIASIPAFCVEPVTSYVPSDVAGAMYLNYEALFASPAFNSVLKSFDIDLDEVLKSAGIEGDDKNVKIGTLVSGLFPIGIILQVAWIIFLAIWMLIGLPYGPGVSTLTTIPV